MLDVRSYSPSASAGKRKRCSMHLPPISPNRVVENFESIGRGLHRKNPKRYRVSSDRPRTPDERAALNEQLESNAGKDPNFAAELNQDLLQYSKGERDPPLCSQINNGLSTFEIPMPRSMWGKKISFGGAIGKRDAASLAKELRRDHDPDWYDTRVINRLTANSALYSDPEAGMGYRGTIKEHAENHARITVIKNMSMVDLRRKLLGNLYRIQTTCCMWILQ